MRTLPSLTVYAVSSALLCTTALLSSSALQAQFSAVAPRITANVDESSLTTLKGNVPQRARAQYDQGEAPGSTQMDHVRLVLQRSSEQQAALDAYQAELQDKSSPNYHKWLTPAEFGKLYGPADSDVAALVAWLESHGLKLETVSLGRTNIAFSGTVSQVEEAFHTTIHSFAVNEEQFLSNTTDPQIPAALAPVVKGVANLNTIHPKPLSVRGSPGKYNPESKRIEPANAANPSLTFGSGTNSNPYLLYLVPADAATIYDTPNSYNANFSSGTSYTGAGVNIGIGGAATITASIVQTYRSLFLGNSTAPIINYCTSSHSCSSTPGSGYDNKDDGPEAYLDNELSGGMAPGATIYYYASTDLFTGIEAAIDANVVDIFSLSFGDCESDLVNGGNAQMNSLWEQAAGQGITVTVSTGDSGSAGCDYPTASNGNNVPDATGGLAVSGFASTPYNIAVGGTDFYPLVNSFSSYVSESEGSSSTYYRTAKGYIPESTWNTSTYNNTTISENDPISSVAGFSSSDNNIVAGSGGKSSVYSKPSWQTGTGVPADSARDLPDVSLMAGDGWYYAMWLVCDATHDCANLSETGVDAYGGTSTSSPTFAGILALVVQKAGGHPSGRLGQAASELYTLYNGSNASAIFHDITVGNNSVPCTSAPDHSCVEDTAGYYFESGYNTTTGYDLATGIGSVDAKQLVNYWSSGTGTATPTVTITAPTPDPVTTAQILSVPVSVTGSSSLETTPTGTVTLTGGGYTSAAETLVSGSYTFSVPAGSLTTGSDTLTVTYNGDTVYASASKTASVTVDGLTPTVTIHSSAASINSNQTVTIYGAVSGTDGTPTGTVTLTGGGYSSSQTLSSGSYSFTIPYNTFTSTETVTLTVTYNGNSIYDSANNQTNVGVTYVQPLTPTVTVTPTPNTLDSSQSLSVKVAVSGSSSQETYPSGTVMLAATVTGSSTVLYSLTETLASGSYTFTIPADTFKASESITLTATYNGDADYYSNTGTSSVTVTQSVFALNQPAPVVTPTTIAPGASATATITVSSSTLYSGTVTLSCVLTSPTNLTDPPSCSITSGSTVDMSAGAPTPATSTARVTTTAATSELVYPKLPGKGWAGAGGGAILALLVFMGIPSRRRSWRQMLGAVVLMAAIGGLAGCGSTSGGGTSSQGNPGTTAGAYTFKVTGTGNDSANTTESTTFTVTVN